MKKAISCGLLTVLCLKKPAHAQHYYYNDQSSDAPFTWELGASAGGMNCFTDLGGNKGAGKGFMKDLNPSCTRFSTGIHLSALYQSILGARLEVIYGKVTAADSVLKNTPSGSQGRYQRNLHFSSSIMEVSLLAEFHPLACLAWRKGNDPSRLSPYLLAGVGLFYFNPQAKIGNNWFYLNPLHTEGQGFKEYPDRTLYRLTQLNIPAGAGCRLQLSNILTARFEILHRILFTDYLDDVSTAYINPEAFGTNLNAMEAEKALRLSDRRAELDHNQPQTWPAKRGNAGKKDAYFTVQLKIGLLLNRIRGN